MKPLSAFTIEAEYQRLEHRLGWRFLTCPERNIETATVALITINPGGEECVAPLWSVENGNAYVVEGWKDLPPGKHKLQLQVKFLFQIMGVQPEQVLSGYLVPFRSRSWKALPKKSASIEFGMDLWRGVFRRAKTKTVVAFGKEITPYVTDLLKAVLHAKHPAAWGDLTIDAYRFGTEGRLIVLPHLSRFALFGRKSAPVSENAFLASLE
jgi:hypothetical protein